MFSKDQPSVLAVCVPGIASDMDASDVLDLLAARENAAMSVRNTASTGDSLSIKCDACDDSACGLDAVGESTPSLSDSRDAGSSRSCQPSFFHAESGKKALELLRMLRFDLLVTGDELPDMPVGHLIRRVRAAWPWQKWAMVGSAISPQDEIAARTLGAMAVLDAPADWEVLGSLASAAAGRADSSNLTRTEMESAISLHRATAGDPVLRRKQSRVPDRMAEPAAAGSRRSVILSRDMAKRSVG